MPGFVWLRLPRQTLGDRSKKAAAQGARRSMTAKQQFESFLRPYDPASRPGTRLSQ